MDRQAHWQRVYTTKKPAELSWYQLEPEISLRLLTALPRGEGRIIDVGGGESRLVDRLLQAGYTEITVLDVSPAALEQSRRRLGAQAFQVRWLAADILASESPGQFDLWHDRAVFHFLTDPAEQARYTAIAAQSIVPGGYLVIGTFALDGPEKCSGLNVCRYDAAGLAARFAGDFTPVSDCRHLHTTPWGKPQPFTFCVLHRA